MDAVEDVKERLSIEDVISEYVELKRAGSNWRGLSPFTSEHTPSFMVSPEKQIWHDFSSGKGGNMFSFVMEMEGLEFKDALELLARKAGIDLSQYRSGHSSNNAQQKERLYKILELATKFYQVQFSKHTPALQYVLQKRQFTKQTALDWQIGYAPNRPTALVEYLRSKKCPEEDIQQAGLANKGYRGLMDMFRGRIMIPLADPQGRVIGFTARLLDDNDQGPKYINTRQTLLYDKSRHIFGLHFAKEAIRTSKYVVVAEGNLDVIASYQAGVRQIVATAGTALTESHLKALARFTGDIRLCFDADKAGIAATERAIPIASRVGGSLGIITIPAGKDPDELIKRDINLWQDIITKPQYALDWLIERYSAQLDLQSALGKKQFTDIILPVLRGLSDPVEQDHYIQQVASLLGVSQEAMLAKFHAKPGAARAALKKPAQRDLQLSDKSSAELIKTEERLLAIMLRHPALRTALEPLQPEMFPGEERRALFSFLRDQPAFAGTEEAPQMQHFRECAKIVALQYEELYSDLDDTELHYEATRLQARLIEQYVRVQKKRLSALLHTASEAEVQTLLQQVRTLDQLLSYTKEAA